MLGTSFGLTRQSSGQY